MQSVEATRNVLSPAHRMVGYGITQDSNREDSDPGHALDLDDLRDAYQD